MTNRYKSLNGFLNTIDGNESRSDSIKRLSKSAAGDQHGIFQHFQSNVTEYATRDRYLSMRGGDGDRVGRDIDSLYNLSPKHEDSYVPTEYVSPHLSTRYSPDRVGVQAQRVADGVFQDPYTNKVYDYNEGFKTEDGRSFPAGNAALQSSMMHLANHLDSIGLKKEASFLNSTINENSKSPSESRAATLNAFLKKTKK